MIISVRNTQVWWIFIRKSQVDSIIVNWKTTIILLHNIQEERSGKQKIGSLTVLFTILICSVRRLETEWERRSEKTIFLYKEYSWINMHISRTKACRELRARSDAPSATSRGGLASIARRCSNTNNFYSKYDPFFFSTAYF